MVFDYTRGRMVEVAYFDEAGKPMRAKDGYARFTRVFDARGRVVEEAYFDEAGKPTAFDAGTQRSRWSMTRAATRSRTGISTRSPSRRGPRTDMRG